MSEKLQSCTNHNVTDQINLKGGYQVVSVFRVYGQSDTENNDARMWFDHIHGRVEWTESSLDDQE
jgi:hypothetical protein